MPLAFLVEQIGVACLADLWRIELQCDLPCKLFRLYPDAPLAHLIGAQAKQGWGKRGDEPRFTPNSASCRVRFRFAAGESIVDGVRAPPCEMKAECLPCWPLESRTGFDHRQALNDFSGAASFPKNVIQVCWAAAQSQSFRWQVCPQFERLGLGTLQTVWNRALSCVELPFARGALSVQ